MPAKRVATIAESPREPATMCANHPDRPAVHTTRAVLHQAISLCQECLSRAPHLANE